VAHGLTIDLLVELVRTGLTKAKAERVVAGIRQLCGAAMLRLSSARRETGARYENSTSTGR
jgi:hypothetical protein